MKKYITMLILIVFVSGCSSTVVEEVKVVESYQAEIEVVKDWDLEIGKSKIVSEGVDGSKEVTYRITTKNNKEINREFVSEKIIIEAKPQISKLGMKEDKQSSLPNITEDQSRMLQATTQLVLKKYNIKDDTSPQLKHWSFSINFDSSSNSTYLWNVVTQETSHNRIKAIFQWDGTDEGDLILKYLLIDGKEIVNDLKQ